MGSPGDRGPLAVWTAAGRMTMVRAPFSRHHSNSLTAMSTSARERYGEA